MEKTVQKPSAPYRALMFYLVDDKSNEQRLHDFVDKLLFMGAKPTGVAVIAGVGASQFDPAEVIDIWKTGEQDLFHLVFENLLNIGGDSKEIVESTSLLTDYRDREREPVTILFQEGPFFDVAPTDVTPEIARVRNQLVDRFIQIAEVSEAAYASITMRHYFRTPLELAERPNSLSFHTFYLGQNVFGQDRLAKIKSTFAGAYIRDTAQGVYISVYPHFNPDDKHLPNPPFELVGRLVAETLGG